MGKILVIYHSRTGHTRAMAESVAAGAQAEGATVELKKVQEVKAEEMLAADGIVVGSPVYYGLPSAEIKALFDESVAFHGKLRGKVGGAFASSGVLGGGNETTILAIIKMMLIHGMIVQGNHKGAHYGPAAVGAPDETALAQCRELGQRVAQLAARLT